MTALLTEPVSPRTTTASPNSDTGRRMTPPPSAEAYRTLELERDALADQIGQSFDELHWLRTLAITLSSADPKTNLMSLANSVLPDLRTILRAEAVAIVPTWTVSLSDLPYLANVDCGLPIVTGELPFASSVLGELIRQFENVEATPIVFNRDSALQCVPLQTTARNVVAVPLIHSHIRYGWLIAVNRVPPTRRSTASADVKSTEFGTYEHGLLTTAAGMLAGHARTVELFRNEECLKVSVIETIAGALDARDPYTCGHSRRVGQYATQIAERYGLPTDECERIYITGLLHDVGKIGIPDEVLKKPGKLTDEEFDVIKQHPTIGHTILSPLKGLAFALPGVLHHHERMDGKGYPHGLAGEAIPLSARILAVADSFDAMTSNRSYRNAMTTERAVEILRGGAGTQWDPQVITAWLEVAQTIPPAVS